MKNCKQKDLQDKGVSPESEEGAKVTGEAGAAPEKEAETCLEEKLAAKEEEFNDLQQRLLRLAADFDNYRRRTHKETAEIRRTANERLLREILPIIDNFERALDAAKKDLPENMVTGIEMIYRQLSNFLVQEGVEPVESVGKPFDPVYQDAFEHVETTEFPEGTVTAEVQKGYLLQGKVLRPARVIVAKKLEAKTQTNSCQKGECEDE